MLTWITLFRKDTCSLLGRGSVTQSISGSFSWPRARIHRLSASKNERHDKPSHDKCCVTAVLAYCSNVFVSLCVFSHPSISGRLPLRHLRSCSSAHTNTSRYFARARLLDPRPHIRSTTRRMLFDIYRAHVTWHPSLSRPLFQFPSPGTPYTAPSHQAVSGRVKAFCSSTSAPTSHLPRRRLVPTSGR